MYGWVDTWAITSASLANWRNVVSDTYSARSTLTATGRLGWCCVNRNTSAKPPLPMPSTRVKPGRSGGALRALLTLGPSSSLDLVGEPDGVAHAHDGAQRDRERLGRAQLGRCVPGHGDVRVVHRVAVDDLHLPVDQAHLEVRARQHGVGVG